MTYQMTERPNDWIRSADINGNMWEVRGNCSRRICSPTELNSLPSNTDLVQDMNQNNCNFAQNHHWPGATELQHHDQIAKDRIFASQFGIPEEEMEVDERTYKGETYYVDTSSGDIYDIESSEVIGHWEGGVNGSPTLTSTSND